jgi:NADPH:quinone reductase-like Zn-dependent oxidoreductase
MSEVNRAAWLPEKGAQLKVDQAEMYNPAEGEILVKNKAVTINPADWKMQDLGYFIEKYPTILGTDIAGEIAAIGEGVVSFQKGDRVIAHALAIETKKRSNG